MKLTGMQIKKILEKSVSGKFGMLQISGIKFKYDMNRKAGNRVVEILFNNRPIKKNKYYKVATNSFLVKGGDNFNVFTHGKDICDTGIVDRDAEIMYLKKYPKITAKIEGRIINLTH